MAVVSVDARATTSALSRSTSHVPRSTEQIFKLARYQLREYFSSRRFVVLVGIILAVGAALTAIVAYYRSDLISNNLAFYRGFWGRSAGVIIVLAAVFFGGDAIAGEFQNKTGYFLMGLPVRRATIYVGKYIAALVASVCVLGLFLFILVLNGVYYFGRSALPWQLVPSFLLASVYLMAVLAVTFLLSSLFKASAYGFVFTAILFLFGFTLLQDLVTSLLRMQPWMVISYASGAVGDVFSPSINWGLMGTVSTTSLPGDLSLFTSVTHYTCGVAEGIVIILAYFFVAAVVGLVLFEREEFT